MRITEVSKQFNIPPDTLRYYEKIGLIPPVHRNNSGIRDYDDSDLGWVKFIKCMRNAGLPIEVLTEYVRLFNQGDQTVQERKNILIEQRKILSTKMDEIQNTINILDHKIRDYETKFQKFEKELKRNIN